MTKKKNKKLINVLQFAGFGFPAGFNSVYMMLDSGDVSSDYTVYLWDLDHIYRLEWISNAY